MKYLTFNVGVSMSMSTSMSYLRERQTLGNKKARNLLYVEGTTCPPLALDDCKRPVRVLCLTRTDRQFV